MTPLRANKYRIYPIAFIRADDGNRDTIRLGSYSRADAVAWLAAQPDYCREVLPRKQRTTKQRTTS